MLFGNGCIHFQDNTFSHNFIVQSEYSESPARGNVDIILYRNKHDAYIINIVPADTAHYRSMREVYGMDPAQSQ
jgi:hypothetical protein